MGKRPLNETEKNFAEKNLKILQKELDYVSEALIPRKELAIKTAPMEYDRQLEKLEEELVSLKSQKNELQNSIDILDKQIEEGVDEKTNNTNQAEETTE